MEMRLQRRMKTLEKMVGDGNETTEEKEYIRNMVGQSKGCRWECNYRGEGIH